MDLWTETTPGLKGVLFQPGCTSQRLIKPLQTTQYTGHKLLPGRNMGKSPAVGEASMGAGPSLLGADAADAASKNTLALGEHERSHAASGPQPFSIALQGE